MHRKTESGLAQCNTKNFGGFFIYRNRIRKETVQCGIQASGSIRHHCKAKIFAVPRISNGRVFRGSVCSQNQKIAGGNGRSGGLFCVGFVRGRSKIGEASLRAVCCQGDGRMRRGGEMPLSVNGEGKPPNRHGCVRIIAMTGDAVLFCQSAKRAVDLLFRFALRCGKPECTHGINVPASFLW